MFYTEDFTMRHYVGFSQIGSHIAVYLTNIQSDELEHKFKLVDIEFGEQDNIDVDCLTNTHTIIGVGVH